MAHFAYVDDAGAYKADRNSSLTRRNPFYLRVCVLIPAGEPRRGETIFAPMPPVQSAKSQLF